MYDEVIIKEILDDKKQMKRYRRLAPFEMTDRRIAEIVSLSEDDRDDEGPGGWREVFAIHADHFP